MLIRNYLYIIFCFILWTFTSCNNEETESNASLNVEQNFIFSDSFNVIYLNNYNDQSVTFQLDINAVFPLKMSNIIQSIEDSSATKNTSVEEEAWRYVSRSTFWSKPISLENWQHNPILFLNSIGGGFCDDRASVLAEIWKNWHDSVRVVGLNGHVVSEVYNDNKWKMYDADLMVAYLNSKNEICSVRELEDSSQFISAPQADKAIGTNPIFKTRNPMSGKFAQFYASKKDNDDGTAWHLNAEEPNSTFILPAFSSLRIEINKKTQQANLSVQLSVKSKGQLQIPFVPYSARGDFAYEIDKKSNRIKDSLHYFATNKWINSMYIDNVKSKSVIRYLVNPKLKFFQSENILKLKSSLPIEISKKQEQVISYLSFESTKSLFFDQKSIEYREFLTQLSNYKGIIDKKFLEKQYDRFLSLDQNLSKQQKDALYLLFQKDWNELNFNLKGEEFVILENSYPQSAFYFFIASKYRKLDFVKSLLMDQT